MPESKYIFNLAEFNAFVKQVESYGNDVINLKGILANDLNGGFIRNFKLPNEITDLETKVGGVLPYYLRGCDLPKSIAADELALAHQTISNAEELMYNGLVYEERAREIRAKASSRDIKNGMLEAKLKRIEGIDPVEYLYVVELVEKLYAWRHRDELKTAQKELMALFLKYGMHCQQDIDLHGTPGSIVPKNIVCDSPDMRNSKDLNMKKYQTALSTYFVYKNGTWDSSAPESSSILYGEGNKQKQNEIVADLLEKYKPKPSALKTAQEALAVAIGW